MSAQAVAGPTIRQLARANRGQKPDKNATPDDRATASKPAVKTVLGNPLTVGWPSLPAHVQASILALVPDVLPAEIAAYHAARDRSHRSSKRKSAKESRAVAGAQPAGSGSAAVRAAAAPSAPGPTEAPPAIPAPQPPALAAPPAPPPPAPGILAHLVIGLNETLKLLEASTATLRLRSQVLHDALQAHAAGLLPAAPPARESHPPGPAYVLVPHLSVSPRALVAPVLALAAALNAVVFQHALVVRAARDRLGAARVDDMGEHEVALCKVVPIGNSEVALAAAAGLRRVAAVVVRLDALLPDSTLKAPRHALTLPFAPLKVVTSPSSAGRTAVGPSSATTPPAPAAPVAVRAQLVPLPIKALATSAPLDAGARKAARLGEVRRKRVERKDARGVEREKRAREVGRWAAKGTGKGKGKGKGKGEGRGKGKGTGKGKGEGEGGAKDGQRRRGEGREDGTGLAEASKGRAAGVGASALAA